MNEVDDFPLDILAQHSTINRLYTPITLAWPFPDESQSTKDELVLFLKEGLRRLASSFPWVAGTVKQHHGTFSIGAAKTGIPLSVKQLGSDAWPYSWSAMKQADFPFYMLDEGLVAARATLSHEEDIDKGLPVFLMQINFVPAGLLLTLQGQHGAMDMAGLVQVTRLLARACQDVAFAPEEIRTGNMSRVGLIPLLSDEDYEEARKAADLQRHETQPLELPRSVSSAGLLKWSYFTFTSSTLAELKTEANRTVPSGSYVSTDDVLSTLVWQAMTRARFQGSRISGDMPTTLSRTVDVREVLGVPAAYPGLLVRSADYTCSVEELLEKPLGIIAAKLRSVLDPVSLRESAKLAATQASRGDAPTPHGAANPALDVRLSSWAKERCYDLDFGFGEPVAVRRPAFSEGAREGLVYFLPKTQDGDIVVGICLGKLDIDRFRILDRIKMHACYVG